MKNWFEKFGVDSTRYSAGATEARQIRLYELAPETSTASEWPTDFQKLAQVEFSPRRRVNKATFYCAPSQAVRVTVLLTLWVRQLKNHHTCCTGHN